MPEIPTLHPQIVHFVIALAFIGVGARVLSLLPLPEKLKFISPAGTVLILFSALASVPAAKSGHDAHGPVERVPGARDAVVEHEEWGERARNTLLIVAALELAALALANREKAARGLRVVSALAGLGALFAVYEAGEHGGELVYNYAGGIGLRSGDTTDVTRLLVAGLYHKAMREREAGNGEAAGRLIEELARQMPADEGVRYLRVESMMRDRHDPRGALTALAAMSMPAAGSRFLNRHRLLTAEAWQRSGGTDSARAILDAMKAAAPENTRLAEQADRILRLPPDVPSAPAEPADSAPARPARRAGR